jgi:hypothetical protein
MIRQHRWFLVLFGLGAWATPSPADQFEQLDGPLLVRTLRGSDVTAKAGLTVSEIGSMPALLRDTRSALVLARTDQGNPARLLIVPELRKPNGGVGEPIPVVVLERLDVFDASDPSTRLSTRRDVVVFDGFQVDLDTGQVVPEGQGGDVVFRIKGDGGPRLETVGAAKLYTLSKAPTLDTSKAPQPTPGKTVLPGDFAGRYRLFANGQWSGTLDLKVEGRGVVVGQFRSDLHGTTYPVSGQVATDVASKILFAVKYPRARQEFEGYLWAEGKGAMAGVASIAERPVGFFAIREGGRYAPEGTEIGPLVGPVDDRPGRHVVEILGEGIRFDGKPLTIDDLTKVLKTLVESDASPAPWVVIRASGDQKYADLLRVSEAVISAGVKSLRFEPAEPRK